MKEPLLGVPGEDEEAHSSPSDLLSLEPKPAAAPFERNDPGSIDQVDTVKFEDHGETMETTMHKVCQCRMMAVA